MFNKNKKIIFKAQEEHAQILSPMPKPSSKTIPSWYKKQKNFSNGHNDPVRAIKDKADTTYKFCVPFVDTLTSGYMFTLPATIFVENVGKDGNYKPFINWKVSWTVLDSINTEAHEGYPTPTGFSPFIFRWYAGFKIQTPHGYSSWITHPSHRWDLPFLTMNGFVDTDKQPNSLLMPFFIKEGFEGMIEEGTPIAQIIPVKRENWKSEKLDMSPEDYFIQLNSTKLNYLQTYRKKYWAKKRYE